LVLFVADPLFYLRHSRSDFLGNLFGGLSRSVKLQRLLAALKIGARPARVGAGCSVRPAQAPGEFKPPLACGAAPVLPVSIDPLHELKPQGLGKVAGVGS
jgi:hypothetical protein